jgi:23S rRNA G2069 N7-methylase RlmK/C1962 C5-methylase RlmI
VKHVDWRVKRQAEIRLREKLHPWVFSNELCQRPDKVPPGTLVRVLDSRHHFLAWGMAHPRALISVRLLSWQEEEPPNEAWLAKRLEEAFLKRHLMGYDSYSARVLFGEADQVPGLILDRFVTEEKETVWVLDLQTAAAEVLAPATILWLQAHTKGTFSCLVRRSACEL